jgi:K+-transporting ATPase ATPase C chain
MLKDIRAAILMFIGLAVITGFAYPLGFTAVAKLLFPHQADGSLIMKDGKVMGSELIGQNFASERYFRGRPSATSAPDPQDASKTVGAPYNAAASVGSNLGTTQQALLDRVAEDAAQLTAENPNTPIPVDLITASASGLDPDISPAAALFQVPRVAKARGIPEQRVRDLVGQVMDGRYFGLFGEPHVNMLKLNLALDALQK